MRVQVFENGQIATGCIGKSDAKKRVASKLYRWLTGKRAIVRIGAKPVYAEGDRLYPLQLDHPEMARIPAFRYPIQLAPRCYV